MPHYEVHHSCKLGSEQRDALALAITHLHCTLFTAPSIFVNITFHTDTSSWCRRRTYDGSDGVPMQVNYVGGQRVRKQNYIIGHVRPRGPEQREKMQTLVKEIARIWDEVARPKAHSFKPQQEWETTNAQSRPSGRLDDGRALHNCFIMEDITAGAEQGFLLPLAGQDGHWVKDNMAEFEQRARDGDDSMLNLLQEIKNGIGKGPVIKSNL